MRKTTPSEAIAKIKYFIARIDRLQSDLYSDKKFRTADLNKLKFEFKFVNLWVSIAVFNKNKERADLIIEECEIKYKIAHKLIWEHERIK